MFVRKFYTLNVHQTSTVAQMSACVQSFLLILASGSRPSLRPVEGRLDGFVVEEQIGEQVFKELHHGFLHLYIS